MRERLGAPGSLARASDSGGRNYPIPGVVLSGELSRWSSLGVVVMVEVNDVSGEVLALTDARALSNFADHRGLGSTSIWSLARDQPCAGSP